MKKSYLMIAAAATMLVACSETDSLKEEINDNETVLIGFETYHDKSTKATATDEIDAGSDMTKAHGGFGVWGFKAADVPEASGTPAVTDVSSTTSFTTVFNNVQVWYDGSSLSKGFTYAVPKYWDKNMEYIFFAYAPYDADKAELTKTSGIIKISDIASIQDISGNNSSTEAEDLQYTGASSTSTASVTDYLMATYVTNQKLNSTNQSNYDNNLHGQTVGFTFGHMLSKLQVVLQAKEAYSGIKEIKVKYLTIENMPEKATDKTVFTQTSPTAPAGTYNPAAYTTNLQIINSGDGNDNATAKSDLYILKGGSLSDETLTSPTSQPQTFNYYVAPNTPGTGTKYLLNITYDITYVDNITETVTITDVDLSGKLASLLQNNSYTLTINVALNQIYFNVDAVTGWTTATAQTIDVQ